MRSDTTAIVLAAGSGQRMGTRTEKQFLKLFGKPLYEYAFNTIRDSGLFEAVILVTPDHYGGATRLESCYNAVRTVHTEYTVIHDAARPFVDAAILKDIISELDAGYAAVGVVQDLVDTPIQHRGGLMTGTIPRGGLVSSQTPQGFQTVSLGCALQSVLSQGRDNTELLELIRSRGGRVKLLEGSPWYFKVTHKPDFYAAKGWLLEREQRVAVVTGASSGIGAEVVRCLKDASYRVVNLSRRSGANVGNAGSVKKALDMVITQYGRLDCLVNCAGVAYGFPLTDVDRVQAMEMICTNLMGTVNCLEQGLRRISRGGVIINVGSSGVDNGRAGQGVYGATKAAVVHLSKVAAQEARSRDVSVFTVCPRRTDTPLRRALVGHPEEGLLDPADVGEFIANLCIEKPHYLSGQTFFFPALKESNAS